MKFRAHPNNATAESQRILSDSTFCPYGSQQIRLLDNDYPEVMDFAASLMPDMLSGEDMVRIAPKKELWVRTPLKKIWTILTPVKTTY